MKTTKCFCFCLVLSALGAYSQESVNSGYGNVESARGYKQTSSVGQVFTDTYDGNGTSVLLGIQQDFFERKSVINVNSIADVTGNLSDVIPEINLSEVFVSSEGYELIYTAISSDPSVAKPVIVGDKLTIVQYGEGTATITVTATDSRGTTADVSFGAELVSDKVNPTPCKLSVEAAVIDVACAGGETGEIILAVSGGVAPYTFLWNTGNTGKGIYNLSAGTYSVVVTDSTLCSVVKDFEVKQNSAIAIQETIGQPKCQDSDGTISVEISGGVAPYSLSWKDGSSDYERNGLAAGVYTATVIDARNCRMEKAISLNETGAPSIVIEKIEKTKCGSDNGSIDVAVRGGKEPYTYLWNDGIMVRNRSKLPKGAYTLVVVDGNQCRSVAQAEIVVEPFRRPELALVTVGEQSGKNLVVWQKPETDLIHHYSIWREGIEAGRYEKLGDVPFGETSIFVDPDADILTQSWRYKILAADQCGNESPLSKEHKTIHLQQNRGLHGEVNLVWDSYEGIDYSSYCIYRQTRSGMELFKKVPASLNRYTDPNPPADIIGYYVAVQLRDTIDVTKPLKAESGPFAIAISNIAEVENETPEAVAAIQNTYSISVKHKAIIISNIQNEDVSIYDITGKCLYSIPKAKQAEATVPIAGTYVVKVGDARENVVVK